MASLQHDDPFHEVEPLPPDDQRLVDAYTRVGCSVDELPYSPAMGELLHLLGQDNATNAERREIMGRLLLLRKRARLPCGVGARPPMPVQAQAFFLERRSPFS